MDPDAHKYPYVSPYNFVENAPTILIDPDGRGPIPAGSSNPMYYFLAGMQEMAQTFGQIIDALHPQGNTTLAIENTSNPFATSSLELNTRVGSQAADFFTPNGNSLSVPTPYIGKMELSSRVYTSTSGTAATPYGPVSYEGEVSVNEKGNTSMTNSIYYGLPGNGFYIENKLDLESSESETRAGFRLSGSTPSVQGFRIKMTGDISVGENSDR